MVAPRLRCACTRPTAAPSCTWFTGIADSSAASCEPLQLAVAVSLLLSSLDS